MVRRRLGPKTLMAVRAAYLQLSNLTRTNCVRHTIHLVKRLAPNVTVGFQEFSSFIGIERRALLRDAGHPISEVIRNDHGARSSRSRRASSSSGAVTSRCWDRNDVMSGTVQRGAKPARRISTFAVRESMMSSLC